MEKKNLIALIAVIVLGAGAYMVMHAPQKGQRTGAPPRLAVRAGAQATRPAGHDYELWALPQGGKPVSLGLLPYAQASLLRPLTAACRPRAGWNRTPCARNHFADS